MFLSYLDTLVDICIRSHRREAERVIWSGLWSPRCLTIFFSTFIFDKKQTLKYIEPCTYSRVIKERDNILRKIVIKFCSSPHFQNIVN
jgi:hypothetical protein